MAAASDKSSSGIPPEEEAIDKIIDSIIEEGEMISPALTKFNGVLSYDREKNQWVYAPTLPYIITQILVRVRDPCIAVSHLQYFVHTMRELASLIYAQCVSMDRTDVCEILVARIDRLFRLPHPMFTHPGMYGGVTVETRSNMINIIEKTWTEMTRQLFTLAVRTADPPIIRLDHIEKWTDVGTIPELKTIVKVFKRLNIWKQYRDMVCGSMSFSVNGLYEREGRMITTSLYWGMSSRLDPVHVPNQQGKIDVLYEEFTPQLLTKHPYISDSLCKLFPSTSPLIKLLQQRTDTWSREVQLSWSALVKSVIPPPSAPPLIGTARASSTTPSRTEEDPSS